MNHLFQKDKERSIQIGETKNSYLIKATDS